MNVLNGVCSIASKDPIDVASLLFDSSLRRIGWRCCLGDELPTLEVSVMVHRRKGGTVYIIFIESTIIYYTVFSYLNFEPERDKYGHFAALCTPLPCLAKRETGTVLSHLIVTLVRR